MRGIKIRLHMANLPYVFQVQSLPFLACLAVSQRLLHGSKCNRCSYFYSTSEREQHFLAPLSVAIEKSPGQVILSQIDLEDKDINSYEYNYNIVGMRHSFFPQLVMYLTFAMLYLQKYLQLWIFIMPIRFEQITIPLLRTATDPISNKYWWLNQIQERP